MKSNTLLSYVAATGLLFTGAPLCGAVDLTIETSVTLSWSSEANTIYRILSSTDLETWEVEVARIQGNGERITRHFVAGEVQKYYRAEEVGPGSWLDGSWSGAGCQDNFAVVYDVDIDPTPVTGAYLAKYSDPSFECVADYTLVSLTDDTAVLSQLTVNNELCSPEAEITIRRIDENTILWVSYVAGDPIPEFDYPYYSFGVLTRN